MENQKTTQATLSDLATPKDHKIVEKLAIFTAEGTPLVEVLADIESRLAALEA
jgi:hypothetical protein